MRKTTILAMAALAAVQMASACDAGYRGGRRTIAERQERQRDRIQDGAEEGDLTRREAARLRERSRNIAEDRRDARQDDGVVDRRERRQLRNRQERLSDDIRDQRHDDDVR